MKMKKLRTEDVLEVILRIAHSIKHSGLILNERYLHHFFSHFLQKKHDLLNLAGDKRVTLHPEWPTFNKQTRLLYGRYKKENGKYKPNPNGTAGFIDFAIGNYYEPNIGIEFTLKYEWSHEEITYDFLKLLDKRNPFKISISFNVIFRHLRLVKDRSLRNLEERMNEAFRDAVKRLKSSIDTSREIYFLIAEVDETDNRRFWHYNKVNDNFESGLLNA
jgi:hypothetical protein